MTEARRPALIAATIAATLTITKLVIGLSTGSLAVLAAAVDNFLDFTCSGINVFFLGLSGKPPDTEHRFGHGKADALSGVIQATIIAVGGLYMAGHSVWDMLTTATVRQTIPGIVISLLSVAVSLLLGLYLQKKARSHRSVALRADAFHYLTDIATNVTAALALWLVRMTGSGWWDPVGSLLISAYIVYQSIDILRVSSDELLDRGLPKDSEDSVAEIVRTLGPEARGFTQLRTRRAGRTVFIELRLSLDPGISFQQSHELTETLIRRLRGRFGADTQVMVDTDPA